MHLITVQTRGGIKTQIILDKMEILQLFKNYNKISIAFSSEHIFNIKHSNRGLGGILLEEKEVTSFNKDYDVEEDPLNWIERFDVKNWCMIHLVDGNTSKIIGEALLASKTDDVNMLRGRTDLVVVWDIRIDQDYRGRGYGKLLWNTINSWAKDNGFSEIHVETQNINIGACKFYHKMGGKLIRIDTKAYSDLDEVQLIWGFDL